ncbi:MAG: preprotein translocase subunit SecY [Candidatus Edwardsbacteria bacterium]|nr:preprotein translocase subunit SecY [Candidatus Edwardsbacteria bacterium]MBU1576736.1 preprotein translocase subunit SecY [Candidatus Edwardsbacteria bacterium]MBU2464520.1 preprotein translocase subunit SecY [Candidatus Edwardsbacteria bacterium]MBU2594797.1 preprotein translocase subunit SecY [Candidatus Edwardsbacteria bacterium]
MFEKIKNIFNIPELRRRILFTMALLVVYRIGGHLPTAGIDTQVLAEFFRAQRGTLFGMYDLFVGGNLSRATIFALGIMPYITSSIIMQLMGAVIPFLEKLQREGEQGRKKINQYTRYATVGLALVQSYGISLFLESLAPNGVPVVPHPGLGFKLLTAVTMTAGTVFVMWLGEQITERGIGNGISMIIFVGCLDVIPGDLLNTYISVKGGAIGIIPLTLIGILMILVTAAVVLMTQGARKIPVQYAKRVVGRKVYGGQSTYIPLGFNTAGVIPIIFAQSVLSFPMTLGTFIKGEWAQTLMAMFSPGAFLYNLIYGLMIIFFAYFYTAIVINPGDMADNMKKYGGFIPGIRPGSKTAEYIERILTRITLPGAIFYALIAVLPTILMNAAHIPFYFGGTTLLIIVGVALDTLQQIESHLLMRHYEGFIKKGKISGRSGRM